MTKNRDQNFEIKEEFKLNGDPLFENDNENENENAKGNEDAQENVKENENVGQKFEIGANPFLTDSNKPANEIQNFETFQSNSN